MPRPLHLLSSAAMWSLLAGSLQAQTPVDATDTDPSPAVFAVASADGSSIDVAWRSTDGRLLLSTFSGSDWSQSRQAPLNTNLPLLGGLDRDEVGNRYVAVLRRERVAPAGSYRPDVANVLRVAPGSDRSELLADVNQRTFTERVPIFNPLNMQNDSFVNSEMVYHNGTLAWAFGHNVAGGHESGALIGIGVDGGPRYSGGGGQHPGQVKLAKDGEGFLLAQVFDQGIGLSKLKLAGGNYQWSDFVLVYEIPRANQAEEALTIAGVVPVPDGYLLVFSCGDGWLWNYRKAEVGTEGQCAIKVMKVAHDFDSLPKFDWWKGVKHAQGNFPLRTIAQPPVGKSYLRPIIQQFPDGRSIVVFEQWGKGSQFQPAAPEGIRALMIDTMGQAVAEGPVYPGLRIQKSTRAFDLPNLKRVAWVNGDAQGNRLMMHTLDANLELSSVELGKRSANASRVRNQNLSATPGDPGETAPAPAPPDSTPAPPGPRTLNEVLGVYQREPLENGWHVGRITAGSNQTLTWTNRDGVSWTLAPDLDNGTLRTGPDNPYQRDNIRDFHLEFDGGRVKGFYFNNEFYRRVGD